MYFYTFQIQQEEAYNNVFYYSKNKKPITDLEQVKYNCDDIVAYIQFFTTDDSEEAKVTTVYVNPQYYGKGLATELFKMVIQYLKELDFISIVLDDMSDNYRKSNNLYLKLGFKYVNEYGPEMIMLL